MINYKQGILEQDPKQIAERTYQELLGKGKTLTYTTREQKEEKIGLESFQNLYDLTTK